MNGHGCSSSLAQTGLEKQLTEAGLRHAWFAGCEYINPDLIAQQLGDWNDPKNVLEAARVATENREACVREGRSLAFETVFSSLDKVEFVRQAIQKKFFVRLFFIGTQGPHINAARVAQRMRHGGHQVPIDRIITRWSRSISNCAAVAEAVDRLYIYDNSGDGREPQLVLRATKGQTEKIYVETIPEWAGPIVKSLDLNYVPPLVGF